MSTDTYNLLMLVATALSAAGTIAAVVVALRLAERQNRPRIEVQANVRLIIMPGERAADSPSYCIISLVNVGAVSASVSMLQWKVGWPWRGGFVQMYSDHPLSGRLPTVLQPDQGLDIVYPIEQFAAQAAPIRDNINSRHLPRIAWKRLRAGVYLLTGQSYWQRPSAELLKVIKTGKT